MFSFESCQKLESKLEGLVSRAEDFAAVYTCGPYAVVVSRISLRLMVVDTHAVPKCCGGEANAQIRIYPPEQNGVKAVCCWLWKRMKAMNIKDAGQSLSLLQISDLDSVASQDTKTNCVEVDLTTNGDGDVGHTMVSALIVALYLETEMQSQPRPHAPNGV